MSRHVHIHLGRKTAERLTTARTTDADGEGRWVTINGAHVFVGKGGTITKGPAELKGKSRADAHGAAAKHHEEKAAEHKGRNDDHGAARHTEAAEAHKAASALHGAGHKDAEQASASAEQRSAGAKVVHTSKPKPATHEKLHQEVGRTVAEYGVKKHHDEHAKLQDEYEHADADWKRSSINRAMEKNARQAQGHHADEAEKKARTTSAEAHKSGKREDHEKANVALDRARHALVKAHGTSAHGRQAELQSLQGGHQEKMREADKAKEADARSAEYPEAPAIVKSHPAYNEADYQKAMAAGKTNEQHYGELQRKGAVKNDVGGGKSVTQQAHADAGETHRARAKMWRNSKEDGAGHAADLHEEAAAHHEHIAGNPGDDHRDRGKKLQDIKDRIARAESVIQTGGGKALPKAKAPAKKSAGSGAAAEVKQTMAGVQKAMKKAGEAAEESVHDKKK